jgi:MFS family permease
LRVTATAELIERPSSGALAPLREKTFRTIWTASLFSNFGQLVLGVGAAWEMTRLTSSPAMVAYVQTAMMIPLMFIAVPAGAIADMFDHRKTAMAGLGVSVICSAVLAVLVALGFTTPWTLLIFCAFIGAGVALFTPAWQASVREQVSPEQLHAAVALGAVSYNVARSFGPALGGLIVVAAGAQAAFGVNAVCYIPLFMAYFFWKRVKVPSRLPPERIDRAILSGARYAFHSSPIRIVLIRAVMFGLASAAYAAMGPLIARDLLHGDAGTYGLLLGAAGVGAVAGAFAISKMRELFTTEAAVRIAMIASAVALAIIGLSHNVALTCFGFLIIGGSNILTAGMLNVTVQLFAPRWVTARVLSLFSSSLTGGIAIGSVIWGQVAQNWNVEVAVLASGVVVFLCAMMGFLRPIPESSKTGIEPVELGNTPDVALDLTLRSGPVMIEIDYVVDPERARDFYDVMRKVQRTRLRNGGFSWSIARDIADPSLWTERYECPTWGDYLRMRGRMTEWDRDMQALADSFDIGGERPRVRRKLERPFGSVRWRAESPDPRTEDIGLIVP